MDLVSSYSMSTGLVLHYDKVCRAWQDHMGHMGHLVCSGSPGPTPRMGHMGHLAIPRSRSTGRTRQTTKFWCKDEINSTIYARFGAPDLHVYCLNVNFHVLFIKSPLFSVLYQ